MSQLAMITFLSGNQAVDPGYGVGSPINRPDNSLPGLPPGAVTLPVFPWDPTIDNSLPSGGGNRPDNSLPSGSNRPSNDLPKPGCKYVVKWLACVGLILVPDNSLPGGGSIDNELPETPEPK